ncbi:hypothetical protein WDU94_015656 [Cyamophila willieti]
MFKKIKDVSDCLLLQEDINSVNQWLHKNKLEFNPKKCEAMTFSRKKNTIKHTYKINDNNLERVIIKKDLGITFQENLKFDNHISNNIAAANRNLGLILRHSKFFSEYDTILTLYNALVRSKLEYACAIWSPTSDFLSQKIEKIQASFARVLFLKLNGFYPAYPSAISYSKLREPNLT